MRISEIKQHLNSTEALHFLLPDGSHIPSHFHVTEVGLTTKHFIDCGGTIRHEKMANFQLWSANDTDHRLQSEKLLRIIDLSAKVLGDEDPEIEVEYQTDTIGKYGISFNGKDFMLTAKHTACLAAENCGAPQQKQSLSLSEIGKTACCAPESGCC